MVTPRKSYLDDLDDDIVADGCSVKVPLRDDKRQAAELIELDGGELRREPLDTRKATFGVDAEAGRART
jgi:hypothetical protein